VEVAAEAVVRLERVAVEAVAAALKALTVFLLT